MGLPTKVLNGACDISSVSNLFLVIFKTMNFSSTAHVVNIINMHLKHNLIKRKSLPAATTPGGGELASPPLV